MSERVILGITLRPQILHGPPDELTSLLIRSAIINAPEQDSSNSFQPYKYPLTKK